jgi:hypothetical protein
MPFNLLLLPLLGGYIFLRYWNPTRYHALRAEKERLIILAAIPGVISLIIAFAGMRAGQYFFPCKPGGYCFQTWWIKTVPFDYIGTALSALILAGLVWIPLNRIPICNRDRAIDRVIEQDSIALDLVLKKAQDEAKTVSVTMSNNKVYVGFVTNFFNPAFPIDYIKILPTKSGYRKSENNTVLFTTFYSNALDQIEKDYDEKAIKQAQTERELRTVKAAREQKGDKKLDEQIERLQDSIDKLETELNLTATIADDFGIVLPVREIQSINIFSEYIHAAYFAPTSRGILKILPKN